MKGASKGEGGRGEGLSFRLQSFAELASVLCQSVLGLFSFPFLKAHFFPFFSTGGKTIRNFRDILYHEPWRE